MNATPVERLSYGFNEALLGLYTPTKRQQGLIARVASPDRVMVLADGKPRTEWGDSFMGYYDLRTDRTLYHCWTGASAGPVSMFDFARHGYWMNVLYVDGHAAGLRMTPTEFGEVGVSRGIHEPF